MTFQPQERIGVKRKQVERAINLAMEGRWQEAVEANRAILEAFPGDVETLNRLGKALMETRQYEEARRVYQQALDLDPVNSIARKNLERLSTLSRTAPKEPKAQKAMPDLFIEETGKTGIVTLYGPSRESLAEMNAGDRVNLRRQDNVLVIENDKGEYLGQVEPKLGLRLLRLMEGGNRYEAALTSVDENDSRVIIKEVYQHPSQAGKLSFPTTTKETFRPYIKDALLRQDLGDDFLDDLEEGSGDWESEMPAPRKKILLDRQRAAAMLEEQEEEEEEEETEPEEEFE